MKKITILLLCICIYSTQSSAQQIKKGDKFFGIQTNLIYSDFYTTYPELIINKNEKNLGLHLAPTWQWAVENNFTLGTSAHIGYNSSNDNSFQINGKTYENTYNSFELGVTAFTRFYVDVTRNNKFKFFLNGGASLVNSHEKSKYYYQNWPSTLPITIVEVNRNDNELRANGFIGFGLGFFGKKGNVEINLNSTGLFLGLHKPIGRKK